MDLSIGALGLYALGALTLIWPKRLELAAHYTGMGLAVVASVILLGFSLLALVGVTGGITFQTGRYLLAVDGWSAVFLMITALAGTAVSIYGIGYGRGYLGERIRQLTGLWNLFILSMVLVIMAGDAFTFILAWEIMPSMEWRICSSNRSRRVFALISMGMISPFSSTTSGMTPEIVPTAFSRAQAPDVLQVLIATPLPPSIRGRTSRPEISRFLRDFKENAPSC